MAALTCLSFIVGVALSSKYKMQDTEIEELTDRKAKSADKLHRLRVENESPIARNELHKTAQVDISLQLLAQP